MRDREPVQHQVIEHRRSEAAPVNFGPRAAVGTTIGQNGKRLPSGHDSPGIGDQELPSLLAKSFRGEPPIRAGPGRNGDNGPQEGETICRAKMAVPAPDPARRARAARAGYAPDGKAPERRGAFCL